MQAPKGTGTSPLEIGAIVLIGGAVLFVLVQSSSGGGSSSTTTAVSFAQPDPSSVAALAQATADESENQTQYLSGIAQSGAALAAQLAADQTSIRTASITGATNEYDTYVQAGSAQNVATIQQAMQTQLAAIQAGEQETINQQTATADENVGADEQNTSITNTNSIAGAITSSATWGAIGSVLSAGVSGLTGGLSGLAKLFSGSGSLSLPSGYGPSGYTGSTSTQGSSGGGFTIPTIPLISGTPTPTVNTPEYSTPGIG